MGLMGYAGVVTVKSMASLNTVQSYCVATYFCVPLMKGVVFLLHVSLSFLQTRNCKQEWLNQRTMTFNFIKWTSVSIPRSTALYRHTVKELITQVNIQVNYCADVSDSNIARFICTGVNSVLQGRVTWRLNIYFCCVNWAGCSVHSSTVLCFV